MKNKKKNIMTAVAVLIVFAIITLVAIALTRNFDAKGYVAAVLDHTYYGEVEKAVEIMDGVTEEGLHQQYEDGILAFVENNIISGVEADEETTQQFVALTKKIFGSMKYDVISKKEVGTKQYEVTVSYQPTNVFLKYITYIQEETLRISDKVEAGEYKGTVDEIHVQIQEEFMHNAYSLLEKACNEMEYGEAEKLVFEVSADETGLYHVKEADLQELMIKIMRIDEIQD